MTKLFSENERTHKFNIHRLIHQLEQGRYFSDLNFDEVAIRDWEDRISKNRDKIDTIEKLRNKAYAHTDPSFDLSTLDAPTYKEIESLIEFVEEIIREIGSAIFSEYIETDHLPHYDERFHRMLSDFVGFKEQRMKAWFQEEKGKWPSE